jgi:hypothetical protein
METYSLLRVEDSSVLTDADWETVRELQRVHSLGGCTALSKALDELVTSDPERAARVLEALTPREDVPQGETAEPASGGDIDLWIRDLEALAGGVDVGRQPSWASLAVARKTAR